MPIRTLDGRTISAVGLIVGATVSVTAFFAGPLSDKYNDYIAAVGAGALDGTIDSLIGNDRDYDVKFQFDTLE